MATKKDDKKPAAKPAAKPADKKPAKEAKPKAAPVEEDEFLDDDFAIVTLSDEEGNDVDFEVVWELEYKGKQYSLLHPIEPADDIEEDEVLIFELSPIAGEDDYLDFTLVTDEKLGDAIFAEYERQYDELFGDDDEE